MHMASLRFRPQELDGFGPYIISSISKHQGEGNLVIKFAEGRTMVSESRYANVELVRASLSDSALCMKHYGL